MVTGGARLKSVIIRARQFVHKNVFPGNHNKCVYSTLYSKELYEKKATNKHAVLVTQDTADVHLQKMLHI